ncbi:diguanylate cyclase [Colwellia sp. 4_MG-2023]|uniref:GGDEF domain-containing protein n=1 Tax=unclassified Colwellia TaxID=196834 RepID=UPI001C082578|nr:MULTISPECIES: GGDEF domain-containing protein [unclassified Colwellia]MBU2925203.1 diguanylate cyclase [Colwellia sp. C2M11]MDO6486702.1 diguanylate cyclase [Colwellia sp. 6_MG-2023]MDO6506771.1 diguanylate cyclase [Colwellia sp. 5_MG-2023]MDO6555597.1 diguanylate cyclase [Colwellia sp. 4_MG-2023]MDO6651272.1 diguanylate cyclase [Colwellia sp. 3_MG-2023]
MLFKRISQCLILLFSFVYIATSLAVAIPKKEDSVVGFDEAAIKIEQLIDNNIPLAKFELEKYAKLIGKLPLEQQITYQHLLTDIYILQGKFHLAKQSATDGLSLTLQLSSPSLLISELLYNRGLAYENIGETELAAKDYESGLALAKSLHDNVLISTGLMKLGGIYYLTDRYENSLLVLNDAYSIAKQTDDEKLKGAVNFELGTLYTHLNRNKQAMVYYQQSYEHYKRSNQAILSLNALVNIGMNHVSENEYEQAIIAYETIINEPDSAEVNKIMYSAYLGLSWANLKKNNPNPEASYQYLLLSKQYIGNIEQYDIELQYYVDEAFILFELKRFNEVIDSINRIDKILVSQMPLGHLKIQTRINIVDLQSKTYFELGDYQKAYELQEHRLVLTRLLRDEKETQSIAAVRLALEAKEADLHKKVLENKQALQQISLLEAEQKQKRQKLYLLYIAVVALIFAWLLVKLVQGQHRLYQVSSIDMLTGISNRRELMKKGKKLFQQSKTSNTEFSALMIDIDYFKKINDQFGHECGDLVLKKVVELGKALMRKTDVFGRFGGEEFVALLPNTSKSQANIIAERFRVAVEAYIWDSNGSLPESLHVTISIGVANSIDFTNGESTDLSTLIKKADELLYQAKEQGRNRVCS